MRPFRIPKDTQRYILDILQLSPTEKRELDRHMHRRPDYHHAVLTLMSQGLIKITGTGKKGSPIIYSRITNV